MFFEEQVLKSLKSFALYKAIFSLFPRAHAQAMNEYCGGEMSTEVIVDQNLWSEIVDRRRKWKRPASVAPWYNFTKPFLAYSRKQWMSFDFCVHGPSSRPVLTVFILFYFFFFSFLT